MPTSPTKSLRIRLSSALREGFKVRGWSRTIVVFSRDVPPPGWVQAPLELVVRKEVATAKYGGVSLWATASISSPEVSAAIGLLPPGCLDEVSERSVNEGRSLPKLAHVDFDALTASDWKAIQEAELDVEAGRFLEVVDGPLRSWAAERATPARLLALQSAPGARESQQPANVRTMVVLAVQEGLIDVARRLVAGYRPAGRSDTEERFAWFERELGRQLPAYGSPVRS